ncbi:MAG TPA: hypothetical protein VIJ49_03095, partial [Aestuariivirga sp.]
MRNISGLALIVMTFALSGCVSSALDSLSSLQNGCTTSTSSVSCNSPPTTTPPTTPPTTPTTPTTPPAGPPNTSTITTGDTTITLEKSIYTPPTTAGTTSLTQLLVSPLTTTIANGTATANQQITFNTNTATNASWPNSPVMTYDDFGTCFYDGGTNSIMVNGVAVPTGKCGGGSGGRGLGGIDPLTGIDPSVTTSAGTATSAGSSNSLSGNYKQYRNYSKGVSDQELQIWTWNNSYATQYRDVLASGTAPAHQAWSFGGNYTATANMPTANATVTYAGQFGATATTSNWVDVTKSLAAGKSAPTGAQTVSANNSWQVNGNSTLHANFGTGSFYGTLTPRNWTGLNSNSGLTNINLNSALTNGGACFNQTAACDGSTAQSLANFNSWSNYQSYMSTVVNLNGTITTSTTNTAKPNQVVGTATLDPSAGWITSSGTNPMYAGFFGTV